MNVLSKLSLRLTFALAAAFLLLPQSATADTVISNDTVQPFTCNGGTAVIVNDSNKTFPGFNSGTLFGLLINPAKSGAKVGLNTPKFTSKGFFKEFEIRWIPADPNTSEQDIKNNTVIRFCFSDEAATRIISQEIPLSQFDSFVLQKASVLPAYRFKNQTVKNGQARLSSVKIILNSTSKENSALIGLIKETTTTDLDNPSSAVFISDNCQPPGCVFESLALLRARVQQEREENLNRRNHLR